jgi:hypothetical protein
MYQSHAKFTRNFLNKETRRRSADWYEAFRLYSLYNDIREAYGFGNWPPFIPCYVRRLLR